MSESPSSSAPRRLTSLLVVASLTPALLVAGLAVSPLGEDALVPLLIAGGAATLVVGALAWVILGRLGAVNSWARQFAAGELPAVPDTRDELAALLTAARAAEEGRRQTLNTYRKTLADISSGLGQLAEGHPLPAWKETGSCANEMKAVASAFADASKKVGTLRQRLGVSVKAFQELPVALLAVDESGSIRFANKAFEKLTGRAMSALVKVQLDDLIAPAEGDPFGRPTLDAGGVKNWLTSSSNAECVVELSAGGGVMFRASFAATRSEGSWYIAVRDLSEEYDRLAVDRAATRAICLQSVWGITAQVESEPLEAVQAAVRLLTGEAKQSSGKEQMLPRLGLVKQQLGELDAYVRTLRWLYLSLWGQLPEPLVGEFQAIEPIRAAIDQLAPRFKARNVLISVTDSGGWMCGDEEWIRTAMLGVLAHAAGSTQDSTVGVRLRRLPPSAGSPDDCVAFEVIDAGSPLTAQQLYELVAPYGSLQVPSYLEPGATGFLPGLVLAGELIRRLHGEWEFDATPSGGLIVRFVLPTRAVAATTVAVGSGATEMVPLEELVLGWKLGVA